MSDTSQGEGWWLAGDGKWYPPETAAPSLATPTDASLTQQTSVHLSQEASRDGAPSEQVSAGATSSIADPGTIAPPSPPSSSSGETVVADPASRGKPLLQRPIFWGSAAAVIVLIVIVVAVAASSNHTARQVAATTTTVSPGSAGSTKGSGSTNGSGSTTASGSTSGSDSTSTTGKAATTQPSQLPIGGTASFPDDGPPVYDLTVTQFVDPAQPAERYVTPKIPGDIFVAVALTFKNTGTAEVSQDIYNDTTLYDSNGQGYDGNFEATASGPSFPVGIISDARGESTSGWIMFEVPASSAGFTATFAPTEGEANQAAANMEVELIEALHRPSCRGLTFAPGGEEPVTPRRQPSARRSMCWSSIHSGITNHT